MNNYTMEELLPIVSALTEKYTSKDSTSVSYERAGTLLKAVMYCIREYETAPAEAQLVQGRPSAQHSYYAGYQIVLKKLNHASMQYHLLLKNFQSYGNENYRETVVNAIPGFFKLYDPRFSPQDTIITMDYPVLRPLRDKSGNNITGIDAIDMYIRSLSLEQKFLSGLSEDYIYRVLKKNGPEVDHSYSNVAFEVIRNLFEDYLEDDIPDAELLRKFLKKMVFDQYEANERIYDYICGAVDDCVTLIKNSRKE